MTLINHAHRLTSAPYPTFWHARCGTTWTGKIFDNSTHTLYRHEPDSWGSLIAIPLFPDLAETFRFYAVATNYITHLPEIRKTKVAGSLPLFPKQGETALGFRIRQTSVMCVKALSNYFGEVNIPRLLEPRSHLGPVGSRSNPQHA